MIDSNVEFMFYLGAGMFCTLFVQLYQLRSKGLRKLHVAQDAFTCSLLTACVCVPLYEYVPDLPYALCLPIGGGLGTLGFAGWQKFVSSLFDLVLERILFILDMNSSTDSKKKHDINDKSEK